MRREALDNFLLTGKNQVQRILDEYIAFYNVQRPHQGSSNRFRRQVNRGRQAVPSARVLFWVGFITAITDRRRKGWNKTPYESHAGQNHIMNHPIAGSDLEKLRVNIPGCFPRCTIYAQQDCRFQWEFAILHADGVLARHRMLMTVIRLIVLVLLIDEMVLIIMIMMMERKHDAGRPKESP